MNAVEGKIDSLPGFNYVSVSANNTNLSFLSLTTGSWNIGSPPPDQGTNGLWAAGGVPEPATWAMLLAGFVALGLFGRRSAKTVAAA